MEDFNIAVDPKDSERNSKDSKSVSLRRVDGRIIANFSRSNGIDYINYEKIFADLNEFTKFTDKFFDL
jgi:hypothetical protein